MQSRAHAPQHRCGIPPLHCHWQALHQIFPRSGLPWLRCINSIVLWIMQMYVTRGLQWLQWRVPSLDYAWNDLRSPWLYLSVAAAPAFHTSPTNSLHYEAQTHLYEWRVITRGEATPMPHAHNVRWQTEISIQLTRVGLCPNIYFCQRIFLVVT